MKGAEDEDDNDEQDTLVAGPLRMKESSPSTLPDISGSKATNCQKILTVTVSPVGAVVVVADEIRSLATVNVMSKVAGLGCICLSPIVLSAIRTEGFAGGESSDRVTDESCAYACAEAGFITFIPFASVTRTLG